MANSVKEIFIGGSRNIRHTPGMKTDRLKDNTKGSDDKDGIKDNININIAQPPHRH